MQIWSQPLQIPPHICKEGHPLQILTSGSFAKDGLSCIFVVAFVVFGALFVSPAKSLIVPLDYCKSLHFPSVSDMFHIYSMDLYKTKQNKTAENKLNELHFHMLANCRRNLYTEYAETVMVHKFQMESNVKETNIRNSDLTQNKGKLNTAKY